MSGLILEASGLHFGYRGAPNAVISGFHIAIGEGELVAVRGASGSGKSTLLYLLGLFVQPDQGRILLNGIDTTMLGDADRSRVRAHRIGFVFQDAALHTSLPLVENVAEGAYYTGATYEHAIWRAQRLLVTYGIREIGSRTPSRVSGGEAQRAALCRALMKDPVLLLADEPTGNLDPENASVVLAGLRSAAGSGAGVLIVTHSPSIASTCDRVVVLGA